MSWVWYCWNILFSLAGYKRDGSHYFKARSRSIFKINFFCHLLSERELKFNDNKHLNNLKKHMLINLFEIDFSQSLLAIIWMFTIRMLLTCCFQFTNFETINFKYSQVVRMRDSLHNIKQNYIVYLVLLNYILLSRTKKKVYPS